MQMASISCQEREREREKGRKREWHDRGRDASCVNDEDGSGKPIDLRLR
jgi:hypothetical protein